MKTEPFEIFDASGQPLGLAPRERVHREGLWHRAVNVLLFRSDGQLIIQRRQWHKDICPGVWDFSVAEHLQPGESFLQAALRGLQEELAVAGVALTAIGGSYRHRLDIPERGVSDHELQQCFQGQYDGELRPDADEVAEVTQIGWSELLAELAKRPDDFTPWFRDHARTLTGPPALDTRI